VHRKARGVGWIALPALGRANVPGAGASAGNAPIVENDAG
jgi:hypothetical protein